MEPHVSGLRTSKLGFCHAVDSEVILASNDHFEDGLEHVEALMATLL